jgi:guanosine-diphosphatase
VYAWITANYLLGTIGVGQHEEKGKGTYAVLDLGGASTQIIFEPAFTKPRKHLEDGEHKYELTFGGKTHVLYQHSYLGYGLMHARRHVHSLVDFMASIRATPPSEKERKDVLWEIPALRRERTGLWRSLMNTLELRRM